MNNDNLVKSSDQNLEPQMAQIEMDSTERFENDENVTKSTAAEGVLITEKQDAHSKEKMDIPYKANEEQDLDELSHSSLVTNETENDIDEERDLDELSHNSIATKTTSDELDLDDLIHQSPPIDDYDKENPL